MIYLLDGHEFNVSNVMEFLDSNELKITSYANFNMQKTIREKLEQAAKTNELIHTQWLRGIGKTHELVRAAKLLGGCIVLEPNHEQAKLIGEREKYDNVFPASLDFLRNRTFNGTTYDKSITLPVLIDEGVTNLEAIKDLGYEIITGFYTPVKEEERSFAERVKQTLKNEIESLTPKLKKCRENGDYGTYKNLINAYREVLGLLRELLRDSSSRALW